MIPYIHYQKDEKYMLKNYFLAVLPILCFGFYKNGILLYQHEFILFPRVFLPLYFYGISAIVGALVSILYQEEKSLNILFCLLVSSTISMNSNLFFYPILLFIGLFTSKYLEKRLKITFHIPSFIHLISLFSLLLGSYSYMNIAEKLDKFHYTISDYFLGYGVGGIASTSLLLIIIGLIILSFNRFYKKEIAFSSLTSFVITSLIFIFFISKQEVLSLLTNGNIYFSLVFLAPLVNSLYEKKSMIIDGILIGILTSILSILINPIESVFGVILVVYFFSSFIKKLHESKRKPKQ